MKRIATLLVLTLVCAATANAAVLFQDDFNDGVLDTQKWAKVRITGSGMGWLDGVGNSTTEAGGSLTLLQASTDNGGGVKSAFINVDPTEIITVTKRMKVSYTNSYFTGYHLMNDNAGVQVVRHGHYNYDYSTRHYHGFGQAQGDGGVFLPGIWGQWFTEQVVYNPVTGQTTYSVNGGPAINIIGGVMAGDSIQLILGSYGWGTGHRTDIDWITVEGSTVPEPATLAILGLGCLFLRRIRR